MKSKHVLPILFAAFVCTRAAAQEVIPATSFGNNGTFQQAVDGDEVGAGHPIVQPDSKLLIAVGTSDEAGYSTSQFIYRITKDGQLDLSFANNGILQTGLLANIPHSITRGNFFNLLPDGKIVVAITLLDRTNDILDKIAIERYMPDGKPDSSFGTNGASIFSLPYPDYLNVSDLQIKPNGKILVRAQGFNETSYEPISVIVQFYSNGHTDGSFGDSGILQLTSPYEEKNIYQLQVLPNDQFVTTGNFSSTDGIHYGTCETVHKANGSIDSTKGTDGVIINGYSEYPISGITVQNNKLLVYTSIQDGDSLAAVLFRYNADGTLDNSFGSNGMVKAFSYKPYYSSFPYTVKVQDNGKIIINGVEQLQHSNNQQLLRFNANGSRDYTFGTNGVLPTSLPSFALNHVRLYAVGTEGEYPTQVTVNAYDFCYTCAISEENNKLITQLKTPDALPRTTALQFYPNPVKDKLVITGLPAAAITTLQLTDANGRVVQKATTQNTTFQWNVQSLTPGVYYLNILKDKTLPVTYKVIKE